MNTILKASRPADFLLAMPRLLGYTPSKSIVIQTLRSKRTEATLRIDLPPLVRGASDQRVADALIRLISRVPGIDAALVLIYADGESNSAAGALLPRSALAERIVTRMRSAGLTVIEAICIDRDRWQSYLDGEKGTLAELEGGAMEAQLITSGLEGELPERMGAPPLEVRPAGERAGLVQACRPFTGDSPRGTRIQEPSVAMDVWKQAMDSVPAELGVEQIAPLIWSLQAKAARDCVLMQLAWGAQGGAEAADHTADLHAGREIPDDSILQSFAGQRKTAPNGLRIECAVQLLRTVAAFAPEPWRLAPLTMLGWLEWARGSGSASGDYLEAALAIAPDYELARLLRAMVGEGILPDWVGRAPI